MVKVLAGKNGEEDPARALAIDRGLAERAAEGDRSAFEQIHRRHVGRVYGLSLRLTADVPEAERLTQDTFVRAWFAIGGYAGRGNLAGWLSRVAVNLWRDRFRSRSRRSRLLESMTAAEYDDGPKHAAANMSGSRTGDTDGVVDLLTTLDLERGLARLPAGAREVFVFHDVEGYTHREIADLLGVAVGTVKAQLHRARRLLRKMLAEERNSAHEA